MTPATFQAPDNPRKQIGSAVWLLMLLARFTPSNWTGEKAVYVASGNVVSDAELRAWLDVTPRTLMVWRRRLKAAGFIDWTLKPGVGRVYVIAAVNQVFGTFAEASALAQKPAEEPNKPATQSFASEPVTSRWLQ
jgi:hypothetical protein